MAPAAVLSLIIGSIYSAMFHLLYGKTIKELVTFIIAGIVGFWLGQAIAVIFNWEFLSIGTLHIIEATAVCWLSLYLMRWLRQR